MKLESWTAPRPSGEASEEMAVTLGTGRAAKVLILPAWFDEANKLRRLTLETMRRLHEAEIDSFLPDLPGCNESLASLKAQTLEGWRAAAEAACDQFGATHVLAIRAGALIAPQNLPRFQYAPLAGSKLLAALLRAQTMAEREAGRQVTRQDLLEQGREEGLVLAGWALGARMVRALEEAASAETAKQSTIEASDLGGPGLWLRAEPAHDAAQAERLAQIIANGISSESAA